MWPTSTLVPIADKHLVTKCNASKVPDVVLTRERGKNDKVKEMLEIRGVHCLEVPMVETEEGPDASALPDMLRTRSFEWICITSPEAAAVFIHGWRQADKPDVRIAVVGEGTGKILEAAQEPTLVPQFTPTVVRHHCQRY